jgi:hypothetical protein
MARSTTAIAKRFTKQLGITCRVDCRTNDHGVVAKNGDCYFANVWGRAGQQFAHAEGPTRDAALETLDAQCELCPVCQQLAIKCECPEQCDCLELTESGSYPGAHFGYEPDPDCSKCHGTGVL